jgi:hypothetical protein
MQGAKVMKRTLWLTVKWGWIVLSVLLLLITLALFDGSPKSDVEILLGYGLLVLTFPIGLLLSIAEGFVGRAVFNLLGLTATTTYMSLVTTWLVYTVAGYVQWFVLLPWVIRRLRAKSAHRQSTLPKEI